MILFGRYEFVHGVRAPARGGSSGDRNRENSRHPSFLSRSCAYPLIRGTQFRCRTTASGHLEHTEGQCPTLGKRWASHIPPRSGVSPPWLPAEVGCLAVLPFVSGRALNKLLTMSAAEGFEGAERLANNGSNLLAGTILETIEQRIKHPHLNDKLASELEVQGYAVNSRRAVRRCHNYEGRDHMAMLKPAPPFG